MTCDHCGEPILPGEPLGDIENATVHYECFRRMMLGSVGHQKCECSCCGKVDTSEDGLTLREAAKAASEYHFPHHQAVAWPWEVFQRGNFRH